MPGDGREAYPPSDCAVARRDGLLRPDREGGRSWRLPVRAAQLPGLGGAAAQHPTSPEGDRHGGGRRRRPGTEEPNVERGSENWLSNPRVYEIAKELGVPSKDLLAKLSSMGVEAKSHSSTVSQDVADKLRSSAGGGRPARSGQSRSDQGDARPAQGRTSQGAASQSGQAGQTRSGQARPSQPGGQARTGQPGAGQGQPGAGQGGTGQARPAQPGTGQRPGQPTGQPRPGQPGAG